MRNRMMDLSAVLFLLFITTLLLPALDEEVPLQHTVMVDATALASWLVDMSRFVAELDYRYMPGRVGLDAAFIYTTTALTFEDIPQVSSYALFAGPVFRLGKSDAPEGFWIRLRAAAAYGTLKAEGENEEGIFEELKDDYFWYGGDLHVGYTFRLKGGRMVLDPYVGLRYLYGYLVPGWGMYFGLAF